VRRRAVFTLALLCAWPASAQYTLPEWTVDSGGGRSQGARFELAGTIGQPDASRVLRGTRFEVAGGLWAAIPPGAIFRDGFED